MKRNYEDLQKEIDALNTKLVNVKDAETDLKGKLDNEDMEKDNEIKNRIDDRIQDCDKDINGDKLEDGKLRPFSLQFKKKDIIAAINKMVIMFNENNK